MALVQNTYGKGRVRVLRLHREGHTTSRARPQRRSGWKVISANPTLARITPR